jgi:nucleotide-binding universal stress UspA family protein
MKFVVALDGSEPANRALDHAVALASATGGSLSVVHAVVQDVAVAGEDPMASLSEAEERIVAEGPDRAEERGQRILDEALERTGEAGVDATGELLYGDPVQSVPAYAEEVGADGIVVGHRGLSERAESLVGSVAKGITEASSVPVTIVD